MSVAEWLDSIGLSHYANLFAENALDDEDVLVELTDAHLKELGLPLGHRLKIMRAVAVLKETAAAVDPGNDKPPEPTKPDPPAEPVLSEKLTLDDGERSAERRHLTVMFCDIVDSTRMSARLDPEEMRELILAYQQLVAGVIERFEGHLAKFMGDGALTYFGWPQALEDAAERAVRAALEIIELVNRVESPLKEPIAVRVGVATGVVVVGDQIGKGDARERVVVGQAPNMASRLQEIAGANGVIIAESTYRLVGDTFRVEPLGQRVLKGISSPVNCWQVLGEGTAQGRFEALHGRRLTPLFGREEEIETLLRRWSRAKVGNGQAVLIAGEPGIGKSRLTRALIEDLREEDKRDMRLFCSPYHANSALYPVAAHLEKAAGWESSDSGKERLDKLERFVATSGLATADILPLLAAMMSLPTGDRYPPLDLEPRALKIQTLDALVAMVEAFSSEHPMLMIVEDAHWMDPTSIEFLDLLVERLPDFRMLMVVNFRPTFEQRWSGPAHVTSITLNRLEHVQGVEIVESITSGKSLPDDVLQHILSKTDGIPLFVEELTRAVLETGALVDSGDHYDLAEPLSNLAIPGSLQDSLMARLDRLAPAREVAQVCACIGRTTDYALLQAVLAPTSLDTLEHALSSLTASELMFAHGVLPDATFTFKHALIQDAAYQSLLKSRRALYHERIGRALEDLFPAIATSQPEVLAQHFALGDNAQKSIAYWMKAGQRAMAGSGNLEAIEHYQRALAEIEQLDPGPDRNSQELEALIALAVPLTSARGYASGELEKTYSRARDLCSISEDTHNLFPVLYGLWRFYLLRANYDAAKDLSLQLLDMAESTREPVFAVAANRARGSTLFYVGEMTAALDHLNRVIETPATEEQRARVLTFDVVDPWVVSYAYAGWSNWLLGYSDKAREHSEKAVEIAEAIGHKFSIALSKCFATWTYQFSGDRQRTAEIAEDVLVFSKQHMFPFWVGWAEVLLSWAKDDPGPGKKRSAEIAAGLERWRSTGSRLGTSYFLALLSEALAADGQAEEANASIDDARQFADQTGELWWCPEIDRLSCRLASSETSRSPDQSIDCLRAAMERAEERGMTALAVRSGIDLADLLIASGRGDEASDLLDGVCGRFDDGTDPQVLHRADDLRARLGTAQTS